MGSHQLLHQLFPGMSQSIFSIQQFLPAANCGKYRSKTSGECRSHIALHMAMPSTQSSKSPSWHPRKQPSNLLFTSSIHRSICFFHFFIHFSGILVKCLIHVCLPILPLKPPIPKPIPNPIRQPGSRPGTASSCWASLASSSSLGGSSELHEAMTQCLGRQTSLPPRGLLHQQMLS